MTEETLVQEGTAEDNSTEAQLDDNDVRSHKLFLDARRREEEAKAELSRLREAEQNREKSEEQKKLEAQQRYKEILEQKDAEIKALMESHTRENIGRSVREEVIKAGASNEFFIKAAVAEYLELNADDRGDPADYVRKLAEAEQNRVLFNTSAKPIPPGPSGKASIRAESNKKSLKERLLDLNSPDFPAARQEAAEIIKNGGSPDDF